MRKAQGDAPGRGGLAVLPEGRRVFLYSRTCRPGPGPSRKPAFPVPFLIFVCRFLLKNFRPPFSAGKARGGAGSCFSSFYKPRRAASNRGSFKKEGQEALSEKGRSARMLQSDKSTRKPSSVFDGHLSSAAVACGVKRRGRRRYRADLVPSVLHRVGFTGLRPSPAARWALTPPFHPYRGKRGGLFLLHCP